MTTVLLRIHCMIISRYLDRKKVNRSISRSSRYRITNSCKYMTFLRTSCSEKHCSCTSTFYPTPHLSCISRSQTQLTRIFKSGCGYLNKLIATLRWCSYPMWVHICRGKRLSQGSPKSLTPSFSKIFALVPYNLILFIKF